MKRYDARDGEWRKMEGRVLMEVTDTRIAGAEIFAIAKE